MYFSNDDVKHLLIFDIVYSFFSNIVFRRNKLLFRWRWGCDKTCMWSSLSSGHHTYCITPNLQHIHGQRRRQPTTPIVDAANIFGIKVFTMRAPGVLRRAPHRNTRQAPQINLTKVILAEKETCARTMDTTEIRWIANLPVPAWQDPEPLFPPPPPGSLPSAVGHIVNNNILLSGGLTPAGGREGGEADAFSPAAKATDTESAGNVHTHRIEWIRNCEIIVVLCVGIFFVLQGR